MPCCGGPGCAAAPAGGASRARPGWRPSWKPRQISPKRAAGKWPRGGKKHIRGSSGPRGGGTGACWAVQQGRQAPALRAAESKFSRAGREAGTAAAEGARHRSGRSHLPLHQRPLNERCRRGQAFPLVPNIPLLQALHLARDAGGRARGLSEEAALGLLLTGRNAQQGTACAAHMPCPSPRRANGEMLALGQSRALTSTRWLVISCRCRVTEPSLSRMTCRVQSASQLLFWHSKQAGAKLEGVAGPNTSIARLLPKQELEDCRPWGSPCWQQGLACAAGCCKAAGG